MVLHVPDRTFRLNARTANGSNKAPDFHAGAIGNATCPGKRGLSRRAWPGCRPAVHGEIRAARQIVSRFRVRHRHPGRRRSAGRVRRAHAGPRTPGRPPGRRRTTRPCGGSSPNYQALRRVGGLAFHDRAFVGADLQPQGDHHPAVAWTAWRKRSGAREVAMYGDDRNRARGSDTAHSSFLARLSESSTELSSTSTRSHRHRSTGSTRPARLAAPCSAGCGRLARPRGPLCRRPLTRSARLPRPTPRCSLWRCQPLPRPVRVRRSAPPRPFAVPSP
jgi:hypothetical protein